MQCVRRTYATLSFPSAVAVYDNPFYVPIDEVHVKNPINPYGRSK